MTMVVKRPRLRLTRVRVLSILLIIVVALAVAVPITLYWALQRADMHSRWATQVNYASQFTFQMEYAVALMNGTLYPWNSEASQIAGNTMGTANENLNYLAGLDTSHAYQLVKISYAIESIRPSFFTNPFINYSSTQRASLANQLYSLAHKILYAYGNFINYTSSGGTTGPPFWYSGPSPPDEYLLQDAVNIALTLKTPT